jgi:hypothetical protein
MCSQFRDFNDRAAQNSVVSQRSRRRATLLIGIAFALLIGAASAQTETKPVAKTHPVSGFLCDYSRLSQAQDNGDLLVYVKEKGNP